MAEGLGPKRHVPKKHLAVRTGTACGAEQIKAENITSVPQRVTCTPCRNTTRFVDAIARQLVSTNRGKRPRKAQR